MAIKEGQCVTYDKTGTTGKVVRLHSLDGKIWAEIDSTGLLYDVDILETASSENIKRDQKKENERGKERKKRGETKRSQVEGMKDEGSLDGTANICGAG
jgi:hypothetical protein